MGKKHKYIFTTAGTTLDDTADRKKLEELAKQGWIPNSYAWGGFALKLEKTEPQTITYTMDCYNGDQDEYDDYLELFEASGWTKVFSHKEGKWGVLTLFKAKPGTTPLYSDPATLAEHFNTQRNSLLTYYVLPGVVVTALLYGMKSFFDYGIIANLLVAGTVLTLIWSLIMAYCVILFHLKGKKAAQSKDTDLFEVTNTPSTNFKLITTFLITISLFIVYWLMGGDFRPGAGVGASLYLRMLFIIGAVHFFDFISLLSKSWKEKKSEKKKNVSDNSLSANGKYLIYILGRLILFFLASASWVTGFFGLF